jgi:hypothetical protein
MAESDEKSTANTVCAALIFLGIVALAVLSATETKTDVSSYPGDRTTYCERWNAIADEGIKLSQVVRSAERFGENRYDLTCVARKDALFASWSDRRCGKADLPTAAFIYDFRELLGKECP